MVKPKFGVVDTTFSRINLGDIALDELKKLGYRGIRVTVPGIKDLPVTAKKLIEEEGCDIVITLGWVGGTQKDLFSYLALSIGLVMVQLMTNRHVIDVTIHEDEAENEKELIKLAENRVREHVENAVKLMVYPKQLIREAGTGQRQGFEDVGPLMR